ncbi:MAG: thiamine ABC transporter substrate binding subunit [Pseudorhodobacter sp.]
MKHPFLALGFAVTATMAAAETPVLTVLTYDSITSEWGPGPAWETAFEAECNCDLRFVGAGDGAALVARLKLEGARSEASLVLGLDTNLTSAARESGLFAPHGRPSQSDLPVPFEDPLFRPFDWSWLAFVYDKAILPEPPDSFEALAASDLKIVIQDPRSSTPGLSLLMWVKAAYGPRAEEIWAALSDNILTITPSWSEAYGMFTAGEVDMALSYTTSPAYHLIAEKDDSKAAAIFAEGHYMQVELVGKLAAAPQPELADQFLAFMETEAFQSVIPLTNWMYPAHLSGKGLPEGYETLARPEKSLLFSSEEAATIRDEALAEWQAALSR